MKFLILCLAVSFAFPALAASPLPEEAAAFHQARETFYQARGGDSKATQQALDQFEQLSKAHPENPLYRAYYGSSYCIKARDGWFPFAKLANVEAGLDHIGKAVNLLAPEHDGDMIDGVPVSLEARLVAASTFSSVPGIFNRRQQAKDVLADLLASPVFLTSPAPFRAAVYVEAAKIAQKDGSPDQEQAQLRKAIETAPESKAAQKARELLAKPGA